MNNSRDLTSFKSQDDSPYTLGSKLGESQWAVRRAREKGRRCIRERWPYAQKTIEIDKDMAQVNKEACKRQFLDEAKILRHAQHHHVIKFIAAFEIKDNLGFAIVMDCAESNITDFVTGKRRDPQDLKRMGTWFGCLASVVDYIHGVGIRHRDIKPENILLRQGKVLLADFGISRMGIIQTLSTTIPGWPRSRTSAYCAPEVEDGSSRGRSADVFSLGAVFLEILVARSGDFSKITELTKELTDGNGQKSYAKNLDGVQRLVEKQLRRLNATKTSTTEAYNRRMFTLCQEMLHRNRDQRPDAYGVLTKLESFVSSGPGSSTSPFAPCKCHGVLVAGDTKLLQSCKSGSTEEVSNLLGSGIRPSTVGALHQASARGHETIVQKLVTKGASVDLQDWSMDTALHCAAGSAHLGIVKYLLENKAKATLQNLEDRTALFYAAGRGQVDVMKMLIRNMGKDDLKRQDKYKQTALHSAARRGHGRAVQLLLEQFSDPDSKKFVRLFDTRGRTALHLAAGYGSEEVVNTLLQKGSDPNEVDTEGWTALHFVAAGKNVNGRYTQVARLLLEAGADATISAKTAQNRFPSFAAAEEEGELREILEEAYYACKKRRRT